MVEILKILFVLGFSNPFPGAAWTRIGFFAEAWSKKSHSVEILGAFTYKTFRKRGGKRIGRVSIFNAMFHMDLNHPLAFTTNSILSFIVSTFFLIARRPNVTVVSVPAGDTGLGALVACKLLKTKHVVDYRDEWEDYIISLTNSKVGKSFYSVVKKLLASFYAKSQLVTAVTPNFMESLQSRGVVSVRLVPNGADVTVFKQYGKNLIRRKLRLDDDNFIIVYSGLIGGYYKLDTVIKALAKLLSLNKKIRLLMIGDGSDVPNVLELSKNLNLTASVIYLGVKNDKTEIAEILSAGDVGVIPGFYTRGQLPVKFFEYCACGLPVIATVDEDSILAKLIKEREIGLTVPPMDEEKLAEAIYRIYDNDSFRAAAGKRARALIEEKFDRNKIAEEFLNLIIKMVRSEA
jgi:glycosyltransferase involved in cell wall biosynthesis